MKKHITTVVLITAILLAVITRFYKLGEAPMGLYLDEAGQGYSAYSILLTGKDEFGKSFPVVFRSFTDFKTPVYIYILVPLIPIFGLTKFAVRFPSFFFSILTLPFLYLLIKRISPQKYALPLSLMTSFLLAISPWHILFGRTNFECNVALFFFISGVYFFYKGLEKPKVLILSAILLAIAIPAYHAQRLVTPLMGFVLFLKHRKVLLSKTHIKYLLVGGVLVLTISIPTLSVATTPGFLARASGLNIFSTDKQTPSGTVNSDTGILEPVVNGRIYLSTKEFASLYVSYFSPRYMFSLGDYGPRSSYPELSTFFIWQLPFYLLGFYRMIKDKDLKELRFFTLAFLFISPLPAAATTRPLLVNKVTANGNPPSYNN
jgi:4-amino-4-deoxy-L-arabinose transferase-like glycosyltransferase